MATTNGDHETKRMVRSLSELPRDVAPPRDLWSSISAQIAADQASAQRGIADESSRKSASRSRYLPTRLQWSALAAVVAALALGMWLGRSVLPGKPVQQGTGIVANTGGTGSNNGGVPSVAGAQAVPAAAFVTDPRYIKQRKEMVAALEAQLNTLPPETQLKVAGSLKTIRQSMKDIEAALGRDPANALLQELLVNTYQDEMRVLTVVHEASGAGRGI
jgi:hypothetical protein